MQHRVPDSLEGVIAQWAGGSYPRPAPPAGGYVSLLRVLSLAARRPGNPPGSLTRRGRRPRSAVG